MSIAKRFEPIVIEGGRSHRERTSDDIHAYIAVMSKALYAGTIANKDARQFLKMIKALIARVREKNREPTVSRIGELNEIIGRDWAAIESEARRLGLTVADNGE